MQALGAVVFLIVIVAGVVLTSSIKIVQEYERGVIFRLGRCQGAKGPGLFFVVPVIDKISRVNLQQMAVRFNPSRCSPRTTCRQSSMQLPTSR